MNILRKDDEMSNRKYYCDNEITGEPVYREETRLCPVDGFPDDPPLWVQGIWMAGITIAFFCAVVMLFAVN